MCYGSLCFHVNVLYFRNCGTTSTLTQDTIFEITELKPRKFRKENEKVTLGNS